MCPNLFMVRPSQGHVLLIRLSYLMIRTCIGKQMDTRVRDSEVPAQYIQVHMSADDPYILAHATLTGPIYGGQLHTTPVNNMDQPIKPLTDVAMRMFATNFPGRQHVDVAIASINDRTLTAKLKRHWWLEAQITEAGLEHERLE